VISITITIQPDVARLMEIILCTIGLGTVAVWSGHVVLFLREANRRGKERKP